jgi:hypothetical protein
VPAFKLANTWSRTRPPPSSVSSAQNVNGYILLVVGVIGILISMMFWSTWGFGGGRRTTVVED